MEIYAPLGSNAAGPRAADGGGPVDGAAAVAEEDVVPVDRLFEEAGAALGHALSAEERVKLLKALGCDGAARAVPASVIADRFAAMFRGAGGDGDAQPSPPAAAAAPDSSSLTELLVPASVCCWLAASCCFVAAFLPPFADLGGGHDPALQAREITPPSLWHNA